MIQYTLIHIYSRLVTICLTQAKFAAQIGCNDQSGGNMFLPYCFFAPHSPFFSPFLYSYFSLFSLFSMFISFSFHSILSFALSLSAFLHTYTDIHTFELNMLFTDHNNWYQFNWNPFHRVYDVCIYDLCYSYRHGKYILIKFQWYIFNQFFWHLQHLTGKSAFRDTWHSQQVVRTDG